MFENEKFYARIILIGGESKGITIPAQIVKGINLNVGDEVIVLLRKKGVE